MGKRDAGNWDWLPVQGAVLAFVCGLFLIGGVAGCLFAKLAGEDGAQELSDYLCDYLTLARDGTVFRSLSSVFWHRVRDFLVVALVGMTAVSLLAIPLIFAAQGFVFAFSLGCFCRVFGAVGLVPGVLLFGFPAILWVPGLFWIGMQSVSRYVPRLRRGLDETQAASSISSYWLGLAVCGMLVLICVGVEYAVIPVLFRAAARIVL